MRQRRVRKVNPFRNVRQWPTQQDDIAPEGEFIDRFRDVSQAGNVTPWEWLQIQAKTGSSLPQRAGAIPGGVVDNVPVGIAPSTPVVRQARFVNLAVTVSAGAASVQLLASNQRRSYLLIQNNGGANVFITFDRPASLSTGVQIVGGINGSYEPLTPPVSSVWAIALAGINNVVIIEGTT